MEEGFLGEVAFELRPGERCRISRNWWAEGLTK